MNLGFFFSTEKNRNFYSKLHTSYEPLSITDQFPLSPFIQHINAYYKKKITIDMKINLYPIHEISKIINYNPKQKVVYLHNVHQ